MQNLSHPIETMDTMGRKYCPRCDRELPLTAFDFRDAEHSRLQSYCRSCAKSAWRDWYQKEANRGRHLRLVSARRKKRIERHRSLIRALKLRPCTDCGVAFPPEAMDFDHIGPKRREISKLMYVCGTVALIEEILQCEVVCSNCHRVRTKKRLEETDGSCADGPGEG